MLRILLSGLVFDGSGCMATECHSFKAGGSCFGLVAQVLPWVDRCGSFRDSEIWILAVEVICFGEVLGIRSLDFIPM